jgi:hypothetical protein
VKGVLVIAGEKGTVGDEGEDIRPITSDKDPLVDKMPGDDLNQSGTVGKCDQGLRSTLKDEMMENSLLNADTVDNMSSGEI